MLNFNGAFDASIDEISFLNRGFLYGDAVFETVRILDGKILFLEDHYFRLMSSMRIVRMQIPMEFTMEFIEAQILQTVTANDCLGAARVRMTVYRNSGGFYSPQDNSVSYVISAQMLEKPLYEVSDAPYEVDLYKDFYVSRQLLSSLKTTNKMIMVTGSVFAKENGLEGCLLLNDAKNVAEGLNGNLFMLTGNKLVTPPITEGCLNGIMRKQVLEIAKKDEALEVEETVISPFDLQKADELFLTNVIGGLQPISQYRKKSYTKDLAVSLTAKLNAKLRLG